MRRGGGGDEAMEMRGPPAVGAQPRLLIQGQRLDGDLMYRTTESSSRVGGRADMPGRAAAPVCAVRLTPRRPALSLPVHPLVTCQPPRLQQTNSPSRDASPDAARTSAVGGRGGSSQRRVPAAPGAPSPTAAAAAATPTLPPPPLSSLPPPPSPPPLPTPAHTPWPHRGGGCRRGCASPSTWSTAVGGCGPPRPRRSSLAARSFRHHPHRCRRWHSRAGG